MKPVLLALILTTPCLAQETLSWTKKDGTSVKGEWIKGDSKSITILVPMRLSTADLDDASKKQAEDLAILNSIVDRTKSRVNLLGELHRKFIKVYMMRGNLPEREWSPIHRKLLSRIEKQIQHNGSTLDQCLIELAGATKAMAKRNDRRVANHFTIIVSILLGFDPNADEG